MGVHPFYLMFPVALSASMAFMLPVATPTNAIVFAYGNTRIIDMVRLPLHVRLSVSQIKLVIFYFILSVTRFVWLSIAGKIRFRTQYSLHLPNTAQYKHVRC